MLKLNVAIIATLMAAPLFAGAEEMKSVSVKSEMTFTFDVNKDKKLSVDGKTVLNLKTGKMVKGSNYEETGTKYADSEVTINISGQESVNIKSGPKGRIGFSAGSTDVTLMASGEAAANGIVDGGEPHTGLQWNAIANGFMIKREGFQTTLDLMLKSPRAQRDSLLRNVFPVANENDFKMESQSMAAATDLVCVKLAKKIDAFTCTITVQNNESGKVLITEAALAKFNEGVSAMKKQAELGR